MREMKDSGISWIGKMRDDWELTKIKYVSDIVSGEYISKDSYDEEGLYPIVGSNGIIGHSNKYNNNRTVITTGRVGSVGTAHLVDIAWITDNTLILENKSSVRIKFLYYVLPNFDYQYISSGTAQPLITASKLKQQIFAMPSLLQQDIIINFLDSKCAEIDALTADIQSEIETLEEYKRSRIFETVEHGFGHKVFVDTDSDVWQTIPEGWKLVDIKYLFEIVKRIAGKEGYDIIAITQQGLQYKDVSSNAGQLASDYSGYQFVYPGDFAMNHMDLITGWVDLSDKFGVTSPDYRVFRLRYPDRFDRKYYKHIMQCCYMCRIFYSFGRGVSNLGRWRLQTSTFNDFKVPVPPYEEQVIIGKYLDEKVSEIDAIITQKREQLTVLADYKKSLIYEYVTGKKEVPVA